jgi:hypothetical protein
MVNTRSQRLQNLQPVRRARDSCAIAGRLEVLGNGVTYREPTPLRSSNIKAAPSVPAAFSILDKPQVLAKLPVPQRRATAGELTAP